MRAVPFFASLLPLAALGACAPDAPIGPIDLGGRDLGVDAGTVDGGPFDAPATDAPYVDGAPADAPHADAAPHDGGVDLAMDAGPLCLMYDGGGADLGVIGDLGPLVPPDLDAARPDFGIEPPGIKNGCRQLRPCTITLGSDAGLTWDNFARDFFVTYCNRCHSTTLVGRVARHDAPDGRPFGFNWDDRPSVNAHLVQIRNDVGVLNYMPYDNPSLLPCDRRRELVTWIDEGAP